MKPCSIVIAALFGYNVMGWCFSMPFAAGDESFPFCGNADPRLRGV